ncbi:MAG: nucleotide-binding universal stress UspA family protein [Polyangiales bacterium]
MHFTVAEKNMTTGRTHLLIATDLSDNALLAVHEGARLAQALEASVTLLHCFDPSPSVPQLAPVASLGAFGMNPSIGKELEDTILQRLTEISAEHLAGHDAKVAAVRGVGAASTICEYARDHSTNLIVVSTHGRTGLSRMFLGSVAEKIVRHAPCSVFVVR